MAVNGEASVLSRRYLTYGFDQMVMIARACEGAI